MWYWPVRILTDPDPLTYCVCVVRACVVIVTAYSSRSVCRARWPPRLGGMQSIGCGWAVGVRVARGVGILCRWAGFTRALCTLVTAPVCVCACAWHGACTQTHGPSRHHHVNVHVHVHVDEGVLHRSGNHERQASSGMLRGFGDEPAGKGRGAPPGAGLGGGGECRQALQAEQYCAFLYCTVSRPRARRGFRTSGTPALSIGWLSWHTKEPFSSNKNHEHPVQHCTLGRPVKQGQQGRQLLRLIPTPPPSTRPF